MDCVTSEIAGYLNNSSMIRKMFEAGLELKKQYGEDNVYDFSIDDVQHADIIQEEEQPKNAEC